jgi:flagellar basal-body rod modification protein FlgD
VGIGASSGVLTSAAAAQTQTAGSTGAAQPGGALNENTFLQLLVAQMKYQDPMQPVNSTQFVTQLAQFQMLSVLTAMQQDLNTLVAAQTGGGAAAKGSGTGNGSGGTRGSGGSIASGAG